MKKTDGPLLPYPGLAAFQDGDDDTKLFFGRDQEAETLTNLVIAERLSLLYARSGLGKTSLINARLMSMLRERGFLPAVAKLTYNVGGPVDSVVFGFQEEARKRDISIAGKPSDKSLWRIYQAIG